METCLLASRTLRTSLKRSSRLCCFLRSIFFTATCLPLCFSLAMHTMPVEPSPILMKLSRYSRGSPERRESEKTKRVALTQQREAGQELVPVAWFPTRVDDQLQCSSELLVGDSGGLGVRAGAPRRRRVGPRGDVG